MTDPKPLPPFTLPQPEPPRWTLIAMCGDITRPATVDDLRAVVRAIAPISLGIGSVNDITVETFQAIEADRDHWKRRAEVAQLELQRQSFARSCVSTAGSALASERVSMGVKVDELRERAEKAEAALEAQAATRELAAKLAAIQNFALSKCDDDYPADTALAQVELMWREMADGIERLTGAVRQICALQCPTRIEIEEIVLATGVCSEHGIPGKG